MGNTSPVNPKKNATKIVRGGGGGEVETQKTPYGAPGAPRMEESRRIIRKSQCKGCLLGTRQGVEGGKRGPPCDENAVLIHVEKAKEKY